MNTNTHFLKAALRTNALFSFLCATSILLFTQQIADLIGQVHIYILVSLAIGLFSFVAMILFVSEKKTLNVQQAKIITTMDYSWVIGSIGLVLFGSQWFTSEGIVTILIVAMIVGVLAFFQFLGLKKITTST